MQSNLYELIKDINSCSYSEVFFFLYGGESRGKPRPVTYHTPRVAEVERSSLQYAVNDIRYYLDSDNEIEKVREEYNPRSNRKKSVYNIKRDNIKFVEVYLY